MKALLAAVGWLVIGVTNYAGFVGYHHDWNRRYLTSVEKIEFRDRRDRAVGAMLLVAGPLATPAVAITTGFYYRGFSY